MSLKRKPKRVTLAFKFVGLCPYEFASANKIKTGIILFEQIVDTVKLFSPEYSYITRMC